MQNGGENAEILLQMRDDCKKQDCSTQDVTDATLLRFLKCKSMKVDKAAKMFKEHQKWRASYVPLGYVPDSECPNELAAEKLFLQGKSKTGAGVCIFNVRKHDGSKRDLEELKKLTVYMLDKVIASATPESGQFIAIIDLQNIGMKNLDARAFIAGFGIIQSYYPERMGKCYMVNAPGLFSTSWKIIARFLDADLKARIVFVGQDQAKATLLNDLGADVLPTLYGGNAEFVLIQDAVVPNWPPTKPISN